MPEPIMTGNRGITPQEEENIWRLHVVFKLSPTVIGKRMRMSESKISKYLKERRERTGVEVKTERYRIERPL